MKNNNILFILMLYINGLFISQTGLADPIARDNYFFNVNEAKLNFHNQNEKENEGIIYIKGLFLISTCNLISHEVRLKDIYIKDIDIIIDGCDFYESTGKVGRVINKVMFSSLLSFPTEKSIDESMKLRESKIKHYQQYSVINYIISDEQKKQILNSKYHILTLKLQYN
ncbi:fimbrial protein [Providencia sp. Me31A]|uniref:fimbrial protein n=1 Tax=Providencia sp. Me31A TaxID=3392637 RepID=UPI003D2B54D8